MTVFLVLVTGCVAIFVGALVTDALHARRGFWSRRIGRTHFRYANLPVGGVLALVAALFLDDAAMWCALAASWGMGATAIGWAWVDPASDTRADGVA